MSRCIFQHCEFLYFMYREDVEMAASNERRNANRQAKTDSKKSASGAPKVEWKGYINYDVTEAVKRTFEEWLKTNPNIDELTEKAARDGYDIKIRYDERNNAFAAQLYCTNPSSGNAGWCLSMRSKHAYNALTRVLFVHFMAFEEEWSDPSTLHWDDDRW